jgi:hypothetical protein
MSGRWFTDPNEDRGEPVTGIEPDDIAWCLEEGTGHLAGLRALRESGSISHVSLGMNCSGTNADRGGESCSLSTAAPARAFNLHGCLVYGYTNQRNALRIFCG